MSKMQFLIIRGIISLMPFFGALYLSGFDGRLMLVILLTIFSDHISRIKYEEV